MMSFTQLLQVRDHSITNLRRKYNSKWFFSKKSVYKKKGLALSMANLSGFKSDSCNRTDKSYWFKKPINIIKSKSKVPMYIRLKTNMWTHICHL